VTLTSSGVIVKGNFDKGVLIGHGEVIYPDKSRFISEQFKEDAIEVYGTMISPDGKQTLGVFAPFTPEMLSSKKEK
jgi:hypothetical protein